MPGLPLRSRAPGAGAGGEESKRILALDEAAACLHAAGETARAAPGDQAEAVRTRLAIAQRTAVSGAAIANASFALEFDVASLEVCSPRAVHFMAERFRGEAQRGRARKAGGFSRPRFDG